MKRLGCSVTVGGIKCLSLTTGVQEDGTYDIFGHLLSGAGTPRHLHGWAEVTPNGVIVRGGARMKVDQETHLGDGLVLSHSTQEIARMVVERAPTGLTCRLKQEVDDKWLESPRAPTGGAVSRRELSLPLPDVDTAAEWSVALFDARSSDVSLPPGSIRVGFSSPLPFGITFTPRTSNDSG